MSFTDWYNDNKTLFWVGVVILIIVFLIVTGMIFSLAAFFGYHTITNNRKGKKYKTKKVKRYTK